MRTIWQHTQKAIPSLSDAVLYAARHTCASRLVQRGFSIRKLKDWMGHNDIETTMIYAHLSPESLDEGAELLAQTKPNLKVVE